VLDFRNLTIGAVVLGVLFIFLGASRYLVFSLDTLDYCKPGPFDIRPIPRMADRKEFPLNFSPVSPRAFPLVELQRVRHFVGGVVFVRRRFPAIPSAQPLFSTVLSVGTLNTLF